MQAVRHTRISMPRIVSVTRLFVPQRYAEKFHADANEEVMHVISGRMVLRMKSGEEYPAGRNDTLLIPRGVQHKDLFNVGDDLEIFMLHFKWAQADRFFASAAPNCLRRIPERDKNELLLLFDMFRLDSYETDSDFSLAETRLAHLLGIAWRNVFPGAARQRPNDAFSKLTAYAKGYMNAHFSEPIGLDQVAAFLNVSRATLIRAFRHSSELSFNEYLRTIRLQHACSLLQDRTLNLADCAARCGFSDPAYFSRSFKKHFGFSPRQYK